MDSFFCGQKNIIDFLKKQLNDQKRLIQSLLFYGPAQLGKLSLALEFCQSLLCEKNTLPACGNCEHCWSFLKENHPDFLLLKESKGIETSRQIIDFLSYRPQRAKFKVVLVYGFDQFTSEAQNALLKTIEEPPYQSILVFVAEEIERILPTLRSRLLPLRFTPVRYSDLTAWLKERGVNFQKAKEIALISRGRPGLALELLNSSEKLKKRQEAYELFFKLLNSNFFFRSKIIKEITAEKKEKELDFYLHLWLEAAEDQLQKEVQSSGQKASLIKKLDFFKNLLKYHRLIDSTNANRQLILEKLFLEYGSK